MLPLRKFQGRPCRERACAIAAENATQYRSRVLRAGLAASQGMARYLRTLVSNVPGVQDRLIGIQQVSPSGWMIIVGGGDPYEVAYAIYMALFDISELVGSTIHATSISNANPGVVTTDLDHGYNYADPVTITGANPPGYNGTYAVLDATPPNRSIQLGTTYPADQLTALTWASGVVTATFLLPHGVTVGSTFAFAGCQPVARAARAAGPPGAAAAPRRRCKWSCAVPSAPRPLPIPGTRLVSYTFFRRSPRQLVSR